MIHTHLKKIFSDSIVYGIGFIFNRFLNFLLLPLYTHYFSPPEYGIFSLVYALWFFAAVVYLFGMETAFQKFFIENSELQEKQRIFTSTLTFILLTSCLLSAVMYAASPVISHLLTGSKEYSYLIKILSFLLIVDSLARFPMILLNALQLSKLYSIINAVGVILNIVFNILFIAVLNYGIEAILYSYLISYGFILVVSLTAARRYVRFSRGVFSFRPMKPILRFSRAIFYYGICMISLDLIDRFLLGFFKDAETVGIYSACYRIGMVMNLLITGFRVAWFPFFMNLKQHPENKAIFSKVFSLFSYGGLLIFLVISLFTYEIAAIKIGSFSFLDQRYWNGLVILPLILFSYFLFGLYTNLNVAAFFENRTKLLLTSSAIGCLSNLIFNLILIPKFSYLGAAVATLLSYLILFLVLYFSSQKVFPIRYEWNRIIPVVVLTLVLFGLNSAAIGVIKSNLTTFFIKILSVTLLVIVILAYGNFKGLQKVN